jgi:hypothetical protein
MQLELEFLDNSKEELQTSIYRTQYTAHHIQSHLIAPNTKVTYLESKK